MDRYIRRSSIWVKTSLFQCHPLRFKHARYPIWTKPLLLSTREQATPLTFALFISHPAGTTVWARRTAKFSLTHQQPLDDMKDLEVLVRKHPIGYSTEFSGPCTPVCHLMSPVVVVLFPEQGSSQTPARDGSMQVQTWLVLSRAASDHAMRANNLSGT